MCNFEINIKQIFYYKYFRGVTLVIMQSFKKDIFLKNLKHEASKP